MISELENFLGALALMESTLNKLEAKLQENNPKYEPHLFIFNGGAATGKTLLSKLLSKDACQIEDCFVISQDTVKRLVSRINLLGKPFCIIITNTNDRQIENLIKLLKTSWDFISKISYLNFSRRGR